MLGRVSIAKLVDGDNTVHFFRQNASIKSFRHYADKKVIPFIERQLATIKRVDVISERYMPDSLNATTRQRMRHDWSGNITRNWNSYLQNVSSKVEMFVAR